MKEIWKEIKGYPDYEVSTLGNVRSWKGKPINGFHYSRPLNYCFDKDGNPRVSLRTADGISNQKYVRVIVVETFVCRVGILECVIHRDEDKTNCELLNLKIISRKQRKAMSREQGTLAVGAMIKASDLNDKKVIELRRLRKEDRKPYKYLEKKYKISGYAVHAIVTRKSWKHI